MTMTKDDSGSSAKTTIATTAATNGNERKVVDSESSSSPSHKKAKTTSSSFLSILDKNVLTEEREETLREQYWNAKPYRHGRIENIFQVDFLTACKEQIKQNSKVNFKETDLFRVYQSIDLANLVENSELAHQMPAVMQLRQVLYSQEWRSYMERLTQLPSGTLSNQVDCACNCHAPGCHLLCHDDVIGTRKVSYILYLTEPDWKEEEGGALELYDSYETTGNKIREPESIPAKTLLPLFNSMAFFVVEPGRSFHAVAEVLGERPRLSVQGWYHAAQAPPNAEQATLNRLKEPPPQKKNNKQQQNNDDEEPFIRLHDERVQPLEQQRQQRAANADKLLDSDRDYLALFINETYLTKTAMKEIRQRFEEDSSVQLRHFFRKTWNDAIQSNIQKHDSDQPKIVDENYYQWGMSNNDSTGEWKLVGPPHKQRYLQFCQKNNSTTVCQKHAIDRKDPMAMAIPPETESAGVLLDELKQKVMCSPQLARYLNYITSLGVPTGYKGQIRRFRPGLDYTVAHYGILTQQAVLDATICFAAGNGGGGNNPPDNDDDDNNNAEDNGNTAKQTGNGDKPDDDDDDDDLDEQQMDEADMLWQSDDVGGFECYIEADDYENQFTSREGDDNNGESSSSGPADEYNEDDDTNLLSVSASNNTLSLVYRDPGTMRFIKYVGSRAPSSRWDISMVYQVPNDDDDNDDDDNDGKKKQGR